MAIDMASAAEIAVAALEKLMRDQRIFNVGVEAVKREGIFWLATVGFHREFSGGTPHPSGLVLPPRREYRVVTVNSETGEVQSVEMSAQS